MITLSLPIANTIQISMTWFAPWTSRKLGKEDIWSYHKLKLRILLPTHDLSLRLHRLDLKKILKPYLKHFQNSIVSFVNAWLRTWQVLLTNSPTKSQPQQKCFKLVHQNWISMGMHVSQLIWLRVTLLEILFIENLQHPTYFWVKHETSLS